MCAWPCLGVPSRFLRFTMPKSLRKLRSYPCTALRGSPLPLQKKYLGFTEGRFRRQETTTGGSGTNTGTPVLARRRKRAPPLSKGIAFQGYSISDGQAAPSRQQYQGAQPNSAIMAIGAPAVFVPPSGVENPLELLPVEIIGRNRLPDYRLLERIHEIVLQPAIAQAKSEKGTKTLISAGRGIGSNIPVVAELSNLRSQQLLETDQSTVPAPGKEPTFEKCPTLSQSGGCESAHTLFGEIGADCILNRHRSCLDNALLRFTLAFARPQFRSRPSARPGAETESFVAEHSTNPLGAAAAPLVDIGVSTGRVMTGINGEHRVGLLFEFSGLRLVGLEG